MHGSAGCVRGYMLALVVFLFVDAKAQAVFQSPFARLQQSSLDSSASASVFTGLSYPASLGTPRMKWAVSFGKMWMVPGWNQWTGILQISHTKEVMSFALSHEQLNKTVQAQVCVRLAKVIGNGIAAGVLMGFSKSSITGYQAKYTPLARLGFQTQLAPTVLSSFGVTFQGKMYAPYQAKGPLFVSIQACTQLQINTTVIALLQCQKQLFSEVEWMALLQYQPDKKIQLQISCQSMPLWWALKATFLVQYFPVSLSIALHPSLGAVSLFSFYNPILNK